MGCDFECVRLGYIIKANFPQVEPGPTGGVLSLGGGLSKTMNGTKSEQYVKKKQDSKKARGL